MGPVGGELVIRPQKQMVGRSGVRRSVFGVRYGKRLTFLPLTAPVGLSPSSS